jgi:predicted methyltransferase MtxX (methanogen marker protein 4)
MTRYIQLLHKERAILAARAKCSAYLESMFLRWRCNASIASVGSKRMRDIGKVQAIDRQIHRESREFGNLRFRVMGTHGR